MKLKEEHVDGAARQEEVIEQITPLIRELIVNTAAVIEQLNDCPSGRNLGGDVDEIEMSAEDAARLAERITAVVNAGMKRPFRRATVRLDVIT